MASNPQLAAAYDDLMFALLAQPPGAVKGMARMSLMTGAGSLEPEQRQAAPTRGQGAKVRLRRY